MQKQQLALKSLKIHVCFQSWSNFPARNRCDGKVELLYLCPLYCADLVRDTILHIGGKLGIVGEAERSFKQVRVCLLRLRKSLDTKPSFCCLSVVFCMLQVLSKCLNSSIYWFGLVLQCCICFCLVLHGLIYCCCFATHSHLCWSREEVCAERWYPQNVLQEPSRVTNGWFAWKRWVEGWDRAIVMFSIGSTKTRSKKGGLRGIFFSETTQGRLFHVD